MLADLFQQSQVQAVYCAAPVLKVISHFAWNCAEYISRRAYEIEGKKRRKPLWEKNTLKWSINHVEFSEARFIVSLISYKSFYITSWKREVRYTFCYIFDIHNQYVWLKQKLNILYINKINVLTLTNMTDTKFILFVLWQDMKSNLHFYYLLYDFHISLFILNKKVWKIVHERTEYKIIY